MTGSFEDKTKYIHEENVCLAKDVNRPWHRTSCQNDLNHHDCLVHYDSYNDWHNVPSLRTGYDEYFLRKRDKGKPTLKHSTSSRFLRGGPLPFGPPLCDITCGPMAPRSKSAYRPYPGGGGPRSRFEGGDGGSYDLGGGKLGFGL